MRRPKLWPEAAWSGVVAVLAIVAAEYAGADVARRLGFPRGWGTPAAVFAVALVNSLRFLVRELPRQGLPVLYRWLMSWAWLAGWLAILWSAMQIRYDRWAVFYGSLHVLLVIALVLLAGWVSEGRALAGVVFGRPAKKRSNPSSGVEDRWLD